MTKNLQTAKQSLEMTYRMTGTSSTVLVVVFVLNKIEGKLTEGNGEVEDDGHKVAKAEGAVLPHVPDHHHHYRVPDHHHHYHDPDH